MESEPKTLQEAILYFADPTNCREYLVARRWPDGVICPRCGSKNVAFLEKYNRWQCSVTHDARQFTSKTGTIFEDSPIGLDKWLLAMWQVVNCKNGISSYEIHRAIGVTQKTAWFMDHRIRLALGMGPGPKVHRRSRSGRNFHRRQSAQHARGETRAQDHRHWRQRQDRRHGNFGTRQGRQASKVRTTVIPNRKKKALQAEVRKHVEAGSALYTDALKSYEGLTSSSIGVVDHAVQYVDGKVHTNGLENFWSLLKRGITGTYVTVEPFHLFRYLDEQALSLQQSQAHRWRTLQHRRGGRRRQAAHLR